MQLVGNLHVAAQPLEQRIIGHIRLFVGEPPHLDAGDQQENAKKVKNPVELRNQPGTGKNHDRAHNNGTENTKHQHALLQLQRNTEEREQHQPDKNVIDRQRFLDQVAGDELQRFFIGYSAAEAAIQIPPQTGRKKERHGHPDHRPGRRLTERNPMLSATADHKQINRQHDENNNAKRQPQAGIPDAFHTFHSFLRDCLSTATTQQKFMQNDYTPQAA